MRQYAPSYVLIDRGPGRLGAAWWTLSVLLILDQPIALIAGEVGLAWWSLPAGLLSWATYSLWRVASTHIWHSDLAHALLGRWAYRDYPTLDDVETGDYLR